MATDPKATLLGLIQLQKLDADVWRLQRRIAEGPQLLARRSERLRQVEARVAGVAARVLDVKKQVGALELDVKTREAEILKIQGAQGQSRTNEEFRAFGEHIGRLRKENRATEDRMLELMQQIEQIERDATELRSTRDSLAAEAKRDEEQWAKDAIEYQAELAACLARRAEFAATLPAGPLQVYERVLRGRDGKAVVRVEGRVCGGCQMGITPNDIARLHRMHEIVACKSCERILYLPELAGAAG